MAVIAANLARGYSWVELSTGRVYKKSVQSWRQGNITLKEFVTRAEDRIVQGFEADAVETQILFRLGVADAENFELSWEELANMLNPSKL